MGRSGSEAAPCTGAAVRQDALRPSRVGGSREQAPDRQRAPIASTPQEPALAQVASSYGSGMKDRVMTLADGRQLSLSDYGTSDAPVAFYFHGNPTSRLDPGLFEADIDASEVRIVAVDRPGFGGSSPQRGRVLTDWAADVAEVADQLGLESFAVMGLSAGGPYAVMCAAMLHDRVTGLGLVASLADPMWHVIVEGRSDEDRAVLATDDDDAVIALEAERFGADASGFPVGSAGLGAPDVEIFSEDGHGQELRRSVAEAFKQGIAGFAVDRLVYSRPWTFDPGQITAPCEILHGEHDVAVDMAHAERLNDLIPASTLTRLDDHGHLSIIAELPALAARLTH